MPEVGKSRGGADNGEVTRQNAPETHESRQRDPCRGVCGGNTIEDERPRHLNQWVPIKAMCREAETPTDRGIR